MSIEDYQTAKPIFVVTTVVVIDPVKGTWGSHRAWGWHPTREDAWEAVLGNDGDMFECDFNYAVVEEFPPGTLAETARRWWFKATRTVPGMSVTDVEPCDELPGFSRTINFGLG